MFMYATMEHRFRIGTEDASNPRSGTRLSPFVAPTEVERPPGITPDDVSNGIIHRTDAYPHGPGIPRALAPPPSSPGLLSREHEVVPLWESPFARYTVVGD